MTLRSDILESLAVNNVEKGPMEETDTEVELKRFNRHDALMLQLKHLVQALGNRKDIKKWDACLGLST